MARAYTYITKFTSPNQNARNSRIKSITIHHWGSRGQKFDNVVHWLCQKRAGTSAHYVVEAGKVACIVDPDRRAWHAGNSRGNHESIGIECRPEATAGDYATVAALVADLRAVYGNIPLKAHRDWTSTACPGAWNLSKIDRLARGSKPVGIPSGGTSVPAPKPAVKPSGDLTVDGRCGRATITRLQEFLNSVRTEQIGVDGRAGEATWKSLQGYVGAPYRDGLISRQSYRASELGNGIVERSTAWEYTGRGSSGSQTVELLQRRNGATVDGIWGEGTTASVQRWLNRKR